MKYSIRGIIKEKEVILVNEQNNTNPTPQTGNNGVIAPTNINPVQGQQAGVATQQQVGQAPVQSVKQQPAAIEPLPVPNVAPQQVGIQNNGTVTQQAQGQVVNATPVQNNVTVSSANGGVSNVNPPTTQINQQAVQVPQQQAQGQVVTQPTQQMVQPQQEQVQAQQVQPTQQSVQQPVQQPAPETQPVQQVVNAVQPQVNQVQTQPVVPQDINAINQQPQNVQVTPTEQNIVNPSSVTPTNNVVTEPVNQQITDINPQVVNQPINPLENNNQVSPGVFGPSIPIVAGTDATQVGFVPASSEMPKKKNTKLIIAIVVGVIILLAVLGYFVIYPFIMNKFFNNPKNVYDITINELYKGISVKAEEIIHSKALYDIDVTLDTNLEKVKQFSGYTYSVNFGIDPKKELLQSGIKLTNNDNNNEYSTYTYIKNGKEYLKYSNYRGYIYAGELDKEEELEIFGTYQEAFDRAGNLDSADVVYLTNKLSELTKGSIKTEHLSKEDTTLSVNGETIKVTNNKYEAPSNVLKEMIKYIVDGINSDDKSMEILSKYLEIDKKDIEKMLDGIVDNADKKLGDITYTFNIYTFGNKNEIIGFGLTTSDLSKEFQYYLKDNYLEINAKTVEENEETGKTDETKLAVVGKGDGSKMSLNFKLNDSEILNLVVTSWDENKKEMTYNFKVDDLKFTGKLSLVKDLNDERLKYKIQGEINTGDEYIKVTVDITEDWTNDVSNINTDNAVTMEDEDIKKIQDEFMRTLKETPIGKLLTTVSGDYNSAIGDYYSDGNNDIFGIDDPTKNPENNTNNNPVDTTIGETGNNSPTETGTNPVDANTTN